MADWRRRVVVVVAVEDHDAVLVLAPTLASGDLLQGPGLPGHLRPEVVIARPPQGVLIREATPGYLLVLRGEARLWFGLDEDEAAGGGGASRRCEHRS